MPIEIIEEIYDNPEWGKFLDGLDNQYQKDIAGHTMNWIQEFLQDKCPDAVSVLRGELIGEVTKNTDFGE